MPIGTGSEKLITSLEEAIRRVYGLSVGVVGSGSERHERPHKPILLLAAFDLLATGKALPDRIEWNQTLRDRFTIYFDIVRAANDGNTPENPFYYLKNDGIWEAFEQDGGEERELSYTPLVGSFGRVWAKFAGGLERFVVTPADRMFLRQAIIARYFPLKREALIGLAQEGILEQPTSDRNCREESSEYRSGRNSAFRRKILEIYDFQCAACGLRIRLPESDLTFVDAAHLIPFSESNNDHPTNGLALCKNHHWAMDRDLIAPSPDGVWKASSRLIRHRSLGEAQLLELNDQAVIPPNDSAFTPAPEALEWRFRRLQLSA